MGIEIDLCWIFLLGWGIDDFFRSVGFLEPLAPFFWLFLFSILPVYFWAALLYSFCVYYMLFVYPLKKKKEGSIHV